MTFENWQNENLSNAPKDNFSVWQEESKFANWQAQNDKRDGLIKRFGKQFYNTALAAPAQAMGTKSSIGIMKTDIKALGALEEDVKSRYEKGLPLTQQEIEQHSKPYSKWSIGGLFNIDKPEWQQQLRSDYQVGKVNVKKPETQETKIKKLQTVLETARIETAKKADISFAVSEAENWKEKGVDIVAGISGFVSQLVALKKAFPQAPTVFIWELQNQIEGGTPGKGALTYGAFAAPGKIIKGTSVAAKVGRTASESVLLGGMSAVNQKIETGEIKAGEVLIAAGIPLGLRAVGGAKGVLKKALKSKNPKAIKAINEAIKNKPITKTEREVLHKAGFTIEEIGKAKPSELRAMMADPIKKGIDTTNKHILDWAEKGELINKEIRKEAVHKLRQKQTAGYDDVYKQEIKAGKTPSQADRAAKRKLAGKANIPKITPLELSPADKVTLDNKIHTVYDKRTFDKTNTFKVVEKMQKGEIPTPYEFGLLEPILGTETTKELFNSLTTKSGINIWGAVKLIRDVPKALRFGFDPQGARGTSRFTFRHPIIYLSTLGKNIAGIFSKKYAEAREIAMEKSPVTKLGTDKYELNYLSNKPWASTRAGTKLEQYGNVSQVFLRSKNRVVRLIGKWLHASERGANLGINSAFNKLVVKSEKSLAQYNKRGLLSKREIATWRKKRGTDINILGKRVQAKSPEGHAVQEAANWTVFSPAYTASGLMSPPHSLARLVSGKGFSGKTWAMQVMLSRLVGLQAVGTLIGYVGYKWKTKDPTKEPPIDSSPNPLDPLWCKIRAGQEVYDLGFGDIADYRLLARIGLSAHLAVKKAITGKEISTVWGHKVPTAGETFGRYLESKRTLYLSLAKQLISKKDWLGNSVTLKDTALDNLPFEFFQAFVEAGEADGVWADMAEGIDLDVAKKSLDNLLPSAAALGGIGVSSYPVAAYSTKNKFKDIIAKKAYGKTWNDLTIKEQGGLSRVYRKPLDMFARKIKEEAIEKPGSIDRIREEQRKSGNKIRGLLSKNNKAKVAGISVSIDRSPKNFYLNDERYQKYQELVAKYLDERLSKVKIEGKSNAVKDKTLEIILKMAKDKAFMDIKREMK